ncbi:MAG: thioesterase [Clostridiales bacterium]|nr:thioesterase [Clostridiales bacterium]
MLEAGIKNEKIITVLEKDTAASHGSGTLPVFATPAMIALMEKTAMESVAPFLQEGEGTVGTLINVKHSAATPLGGEVRCESELVEVDRRRLVFTVRAFDNRGMIGEGIHERFIVNNEKFMAKLK